MLENEQEFIFDNDVEVPLSDVADDIANDQEVDTSTADESENKQDAPADDAKPTGLASKFAQAKEKALAAKNADQDAPKAEETKESEETETDADEKVPADEEESKETDESKATDAKTSKRGENFKEVVAEREAMKTRLDALDAQFEEHGGVEVVETAIAVLDRLAKGEITDVLNDLPKAARVKAQQTIFESALTNEDNRMFGVNSILQNEFGLSSEISKPMLEKVFEFIAVRLNEDPADFETFIDRDLEFSNTTERELARTKAELERRKKQPAAQEDAEINAQAEDFAAFQNRIDQTYNEFEDSTFTKIANEKLVAFGLDVRPTDTPAIKEAKETFAAAVKHQVGVEMRTSKAFEPLLPFWVENETDKPMFKNAAGAYERAMKGKVENTLKVLSRLFGAKTAKAPAEVQKPANQINNLAQGKQNRSNIIPQKSTEKKTGGFSSAFNQAKQTITR